MVKVSILQVGVGSRAAYPYDAQVKVGIFYLGRNKRAIFRPITTRLNSSGGMRDLLL